MSHVFRPMRSVKIFAYVILLQHYTFMTSKIKLTDNLTSYNIAKTESDLHSCDCYRITST